MFHVGTLVLQMEIIINDNPGVKVCVLGANYVVPQVNSVFNYEDTGVKDAFKVLIRGFQVFKWVFKGVN